MITRTKKKKGGRRSMDGRRDHRGHGTGHKITQNFRVLLSWNLKKKYNPEKELKEERANSIGEGRTRPVQNL